MKTVVWSLAALLVLGAAAVVGPDLARGQRPCFDCIFHAGHHAHAERPGYLSLKTLTSAQADFRANDRDGDGKLNFWRADVAGLYALAPGEGPAIRLIQLSVAAADDRPVVSLRNYAVRDSKSGYWFRAIRHADEDPKALDPNRFAFVAFPDNPSAGKYLFIVDENNTVYHATANGRRGIEVFPTKEELLEQWSKLD